MEFLSNVVSFSLFKLQCTDACINPLNAELNPICHLLALLGGATIVVVSRLRVKPLFLVFVCWVCGLKPYFVKYPCWYEWPCNVHCGWPFWRTFSASINTCKAIINHFRYPELCYLSWFFSRWVVSLALQQICIPLIRGAHFASNI
jgi:hypothetical protein